MQNWGALLLPVAFLAAVAWMVQVIARERTRQLAQRVELQVKLLERVSSAQEFGEFLATPAGERVMQTVTPSQPHYRAYASTHTGMLLVLIALVLLGADFWRLFGSQQEDLRVLGILTLAAGVAFVAAAPLSRIVAHRMGIRVPPDETVPPTR